MIHLLWDQMVKTNRGQILPYINVSLHHTFPVKPISFWNLKVTLLQVNKLCKVQLRESFLNLFSCIYTALREGLHNAYLSHGLTRVSYGKE